MSTNASADAREIDTSGDYQDMLDDLDVAIAEAKRKIENGRIRDERKEKVRASQWRALGYLINVRRQVKETQDLEALSERVAELERGDGEL